MGPEFDIRRHTFQALTRRAPTSNCSSCRPGCSAMLDRSKPPGSVRHRPGGARRSVQGSPPPVDGVSGIELLILAMDVSPHSIPPRLRPDREEVQEPPYTRLLNAIFDNARADIDALAARQNTFVDAIFGEPRVRSMRRAVGTILPYAQIPVARAPFNRPTGGRKVFSAVLIPEIRRSARLRAAP
jgi:hypothetical protein